MLRSVLTLAVVVLAVAFYVHLAESMFIRSTGLGVEAEAASACIAATL